MVQHLNRGTAIRYRLLLFMFIIASIGTSTNVDINSNILLGESCPQELDFFTVALTFSDPTIIQDGDSANVFIEDTASIEIPSHPQLPRKVITLYIPEGYDASTIEVLSFDTTDKGSGHDVAPVSGPFCPSCGGGGGPPEKDPTIYGSSDPYPANVAEVANTQSVKDYKKISLAVYPITYHPLNGTLYFHSSISIKVPTGAAGSQNADRSLEERDYIRSLVDNDFALEDKFEAYVAPRPIESGPWCCEDTDCSLESEECVDYICVVQATPTPEPTPTATPEPTPTATPEPTPNATATPEPTPNATVTPEPTPNATATPGPTPNATTTPGPSPNATSTPAPECSDTEPCPNNFRCVDGTCLDDECRSQYTLCNGECKQDPGTCCDDSAWHPGSTACCTSDDCAKATDSCVANGCVALECPSCQTAEDHACVDRTEGGMCCDETWSAGAACCIDADCVGAGETCQANQCSTLTCEAVQVPCGDTCYDDSAGKCCQGTWYEAGECCDNSGCDDELTCDESRKCQELSCTPCQVVYDHQCVYRTSGVCCDDLWTEGGDCCDDTGCQGGQHCNTTVHLCRDLTGPPVTTPGPITPTPEPGYVCGDMTCDESETPLTCCVDCGCGENDALICTKNKCVEQGLPEPSISIEPSTEPSGGSCGDGTCHVDEGEGTCCRDCGCDNGNECIDNVCVQVEDRVGRVQSALKADQSAYKQLNDLRSEGWRLSVPVIEDEIGDVVDFIITARKGDKTRTIDGSVDLSNDDVMSFFMEKDEEGSVSLLTVFLVVIVTVVIGAAILMRSRTKVVIQVPSGQSNEAHGSSDQWYQEQEPSQGWYSEDNSASSTSDGTYVEQTSSETYSQDWYQ